MPISPPSYFFVTQGQGNSKFIQGCFVPSQIYSIFMIDYLQMVFIQCENEKTALSTPQSMDLCDGAPSVHDVQADELMQMGLKPLTDPLPVLRFDIKLL